MELWRYLRDVLIVVGVLLLVSGVVVSWLAFCLAAYLVALLWSFVWDYKRTPKLPRRVF